MQKDPLNFLDSTFKFLLALIVTISIILFVGILYCHAGEVKIKMLDIGQGDSILIQTETQNILIDTAEPKERENLIRELYDANATVLNKIILSHPHIDHIGNAGFLVKNGVFKVKAIYDNGIASTSKQYKNYIDECTARNVPVTALKTGDVLQLDEDLFFIVYYPDEDLVKAMNRPGRKTDPNNESVIGKLVYKNFSMLFTGDMEKAVETELLTNGTDVSAKILKAAHHGSSTSSTLDFVKAVNPRYVIISAGFENKHGHPDKAALENYIAAGVDPINIFCTAYDGTITITTDGETFSVNSQFHDDWLPKYLAAKQG